MPELPEVETVRRQLARAITGLVVASVDAVETAMLRDCGEDDLRALLPGARVEEVSRLGKFIIIRLGGPVEMYLTLHLGMTGRVLVCEMSGEESPAVSLHSHTRFLFRLEGPGGSITRVEFRDARKFGRLHLTADGPAPRLRGLGPDAWLGDWDAAYLTQRLYGRRAPLKAFLLDQRHLAGIGNIYADEILWWTGISPLRPAGSLSSPEVARLTGEIRRRLEEGVQRAGCTLSDFVDTEGRPGGFQEHLQAYRRQGLVCSRCGETLLRTVIAGRGTAHCPGCQR